MGLYDSFRAALQQLGCIERIFFHDGINVQVRPGISSAPERPLIKCLLSCLGTMCTSDTRGDLNTLRLIRSSVIFLGIFVLCHALVRPTLGQVVNA